MAAKNHHKPIDDGMKVRGMYRLQITAPFDENEIVGDSDWIENQITNLGIQNYIADCMGGVSGSSLITYAALGTGTAPASNATALPGEITGGTKRTNVTAATTSSNRGGIQYTCTFSSTSNFLAALSSLNNVGLFGHSSVNSIAAGQTYTQSTCDTNQNVNLTYILSFT